MTTATRQYPPQQEVERIWAAASGSALCDDPDARAWFDSKELEPALVMALDAARLLPARGGDLPGWAAELRDQGYRLIFKLRDDSGVARNIRFRAFDSRKIKARVATGTSSGGLVLSLGAIDAGARTIVISEGESDWLTWATRPASADHVIGIGSGSWTESHACMVPQRAQVYLRTDPDAAGEQYAQKIAATLQAPRELWRLDMTRVSDDDNDRHRRGDLPADPGADCTRLIAPDPPQRPERDRSRERVVTTAGTTPYGEAALLGECDEIRYAPDKMGNVQLNKSAYRVGQLVGGGEIDEDHAARELKAAARDRKIEKYRITRALTHTAGGFRRGIKNPRSAPVEDEYGRHRVARSGRAPDKACDANELLELEEDDRDCVPVDLVEAPSCADPDVTCAPLLESCGDIEVVRLESGGVHVIRRRGYFALSDVLGTERVVYLRGEQGRGKTTVFAALAGLEEGQRVVYVSCRRALIEDAARRISVRSYRKIKGEIVLEKVERVGICADSLGRLSVPELEIALDGEAQRWPIDLLLIDESEQVAEHLFGGTIARRSRKDGAGAATTSLMCYDKLRMLIKRARRIVCADADLDAGTRELVRGRRDGELVEAGERLVEHLAYSDRRVLRWEKSHELLADLLEHLIAQASLPEAERLPTAVVCTGQGQAARLDAILKMRTISQERLEDLGAGEGCEDLVERLREVWPKIRVLRIDQTTSHKAQQKKFLRDNTTMQGEVDVVIASPTLGTGVSIDWRVSRVYGFATAWYRGISGRAWAQQLWRWRDIADNTWRCWMHVRRDTLPGSWEEVDALGRAGGTLVKRLRGMLRERDVDGRTVTAPQDEAHWSLYCTVESALNRDRACLARAFDRLCRRRGYLVEDVEPDALIRHDAKAITEHNSAARELIKRCEIDSTVKAQRIDWDEAQRIADAGPKDDDERYAAQRAVVVHGRYSSYAEGQARLSSRDVEEYLDGWLGRGRRWAHYQLVRLAFQTAPSQTRETARAALSTLAEWAENGGEWEVREGEGGAVANALVLVQLLQVAGVDPLDPRSYLDPREHDDARTYSLATLRESGLVEWINVNRLEVSRVLPLGRGWADDLVGLVARVLERFKLRRSRRQRWVTNEDGTRTRVRDYWLKDESRDALERWSSVELGRLLGLGARALERWSVEDDDDRRIQLAAGRVYRTMVDADPWSDPTLTEITAHLVEAGVASEYAVRAGIESARVGRELDSELMERLGRAWAANDRQVTEMKH